MKSRSHRNTCTRFTVVLLVYVALAGCPGPTFGPPGETAAAPTADAAPAANATEIALEATPVGVTAAPTRMGTATPTLPRDTLVPLPSPTLQPQITPQATLLESTKIGGRLLSLMRDRKAPYVKTVPHLNEVMEKMERDGGPSVIIGFDRILGDEEIASLEASYGLKFHRVYGKVQSFSPIYSVIVPWEQVRAVSELPSVRSIDTDLWPPPVPINAK